MAYFEDSENLRLSEKTGDNSRLIKEKNTFDFPKPVQLIERILNLSTDPDSIILDSFAGSGTTAHAVLRMNQADGGNRKFILVEMMDYAETITAERVRRVINGYADVPGTGGSFSFYELGESMLLPDGNINGDIDEVKIRSYVFYMETKRPMTAAVYEDNQYFLGKNSDTVYYFYYDKSGVTTLDADFLSTIKTRAKEYIIYADQCVFSVDDLKKRGIVFKKIPRDIQKL